MRKPWVQARVLLKVIGAWMKTYPEAVFKYKYGYGTVGYNAYINLEESRFS